MKCEYLQISNNFTTFKNFNIKVKLHVNKFLNITSTNFFKIWLFYG